MRPYRSWLLILLLVILYTAVFSTLDLLRHFSYSQISNDTAVFDQSLWYFMHGRGFWNSIEAMNHFGMHASPIFFLLLPIYYFFPSPVTLIILQCFAVALSIPIVYLIARKILNEKLALHFAVLLSLYHPLHGVTWDIVNELAFVVAPLFLAFYGILSERYLLVWIGSLLAMACKEEIGLVIGFLGIWLVYHGIKTKKRVIWGNGAALIAVGFGWTAFSITTLIPHFRGGPYRYFTMESRYTEFGNSFSQILFHLVTRPGRAAAAAFTFPKIMYLLELLLPLGFLSLAAPGFLWMTIPTLAANLLSNASMMSMVGARYPAAIIPFVFIAAIFGVKKVIERAQDPPMALHRIVKIQLTLTILSTLLFSSTPLRIGFKIPKLTFHTRTVAKFIKQIQLGTIVATQPNFTAHVSHGCIVSSFFRADADCVLLDPSYGQWYRDSKMTPTEVRRHHFKLKKADDGILLFTHAKGKLVTE